MRKLKETATEMKKETFEFAFAMDTSKEERERGVTIDLMHKPFETQKNYFTIIDAPGHRDFVKNMITGASQADAAILLCSVKEGIQDQTREHAYLLKVLSSLSSSFSERRELLTSIHSVQTLAKIAAANRPTTTVMAVTKKPRMFSSAFKN